MPQISVIVTCYNIAPYLGQCLESVCGQTLQDLEIIVVDDGSSDETPQIIRDWAARDPRIKPILFEENTIGGVASAANAGMDAATGDYVGFADGDDYCEPRMFERLYDAARQADAELSMCRYLEEDERSGERIPPADAARWDVYNAVTPVQLTAETRKDILKFIAVPWRKLYRRNWLEAHNIRFPVGDFFFEDNPVHWMSLISAQQIVMVPEVLCYHRVARAGQTMGTADERLFRIFKHYHIIRDWLVAHNHDAEYRLALLGWAVSQLEWISGRTPPELRRALYDVTQPILADYSDSDIAIMQTQASKGIQADALTSALKAGDFDAFRTALENAPKTQSIWAKGLYGLRQNGVRATARVTARYLRDRVSRPVAAVRRSRSRVSNDDLLFALVILQRRLEAIERKLDDATRAGDDDTPPKT